MGSLRICMLTPFSTERKGASGSLIYVSELSNALIKNQVNDLTIITLGERKRKEENYGLKLSVIRNLKRPRILSFIPAISIASTIRRIRPDVLHFQGTTASPYMLYGLFLSPRGTPKVVTLLGHAIEEMVVRGQLKRNSLPWRIQSWVDRTAFKKFDKIVCVTSKMKSELIGKYGQGLADKIVVIPSGINLDRLHAGGASLPDTLSKNIGKGDGPIILNAKALQPWNGQEYIIRAFSNIVSRYPGAKLVLVGDGPDRDMLVRLIGELSLDGKVIMAGRVDNEVMPKIISMADIIVISSARVEGVEEGSSIFLLEGMGGGKPVIATKVGGNVEAIEDGLTGFLVEEKNAQAISDAISKLLVDPGVAKKVGDAARDYVTLNRTWDGIAESYTKLYSEVSRGKVR